MKCFSTVVISALSLTAFAAPVTNIAARQSSVDPALVPPFGIVAGTGPDGHGNCQGVNGVLIPCSCPPPEDEFLQQLNANVAAGHAVKNPVAPVAFPTDNSPASQIARIQAVIVTLQNLNGAGVGCPAASTDLLAKQQALQAAPAAPAAPAPAPAPAAPATNAAATTGGVDPALVPPFGIVAGTGPDGHGNCQGVNGVLIPCSCPPPEDEFLQQLNANVAAGHAVKNPVAPVAFPTDNSPASQIARIQAVIVTLQNLNGAGVGCPAASTNLLSQQQALQAQL